MLAGGLLITGIEMSRLAEAQSVEASRRLDLLAARASSEIAARMIAYEQMLKSARGMIVAIGVENINRRVFRTYGEAQNFTAQFPGLEGVGLIRNINTGNETAFDAEMPRDRLPMDWMSVPDVSRRNRYVVQMSEPEESNKGAVGLDIAQDPDGRFAAEQSARTGEATISGPTALRRGGRIFSILMLLPVYYGDGAEMRGVRLADRPAVFGWVYASAPTEGFRRMLDSSDGEFTVSLRDITDSSPRAIYSPPEGAAAPAKGLESRTSVHVYGRIWELAIDARPLFFERLNQRGPRKELLMGSMLTAILSILMLFYIRRGPPRDLSAPLALESAQKNLHTVLDAVPAMISYWDKHLINRFANRASENWFGADPGTLGGKSLRQLLGDELFDRDRGYVESALHGEAQAFEQTTAKLDGTGYRHSLTHYVPDLLNGSVAGFYVLVYDISELTNSRLKLAGALRENEELLRTLDMHSTVSVTDDKGYITYVNANFCRILGFRREEVLGRPHSIIQSGVHSRDFWAQMWDTIVTGQPWRGEICNRAKDGSLHWVDAIVAPFLGKDGRIQKYVSIGTNISAAKSTEHKLRYNEAFLERIGAVAGVGGWEFDFLTREVIWSPQTYRIHEVDITHVPHGGEETLFYAPEARQSVQNAFSACEQHGTAWDLELPAVTAKGRAIWVRSIGAAEWENGEPRRLIGALQDITTRKATELELLKASERFAIAADSAGIGVWDMDAASGTLTCDDWMYRIYGIPKTDELQHISSWMAALHPDDRERCEAEIAAAIRGPGDFDSEFRIIRPNGDVRHVRAASRAVRGPDGRSLRTTGVNFDVTETRRREMVARRETASLLRTVLDAASEISIIATDQNLTIKVFNAGAERMLGFSSADVVGRETLARIHDPADLEMCRRMPGVELEGDADLDRILVHPSLLGASHERVYVRKSGSHIKVSQFITQMKSDEGEILGYVCVAHDITQQKVDESELRDAIAKADNANSAKSLFLANMSHEIRTPMNAVIGLSYLLRHTQLNPEQSNLLGKIQSASNSLLAIITNILDLSKIEASELLVDSTAFSLQDLLRDVAAMISIQAEAKSIGFSMHAPSELPEALTGDPTRLRQILLNLLSNAIRFTDQGGVRFEVSQSSAAPGHISLAFAVVDTGIGISRDALDRIFAPFAQADTSITRRYGGTGLGLSIVKRLSELLGGTVDVQSEVGVGSTFTVTLPFLPAALMELSPDDNRPRVEGELLGIRALVVDDSDINLEVAKRILEFDGVDVSLAVDGQKAFDRLRAEPQGFDVVFMDIQMPILDGYEATRRIRGELGLADLPIIAVTAGALSSERRRAETAGMTDFICKPFDGQSLGRLILRHVRPRNRRRTPEPSADPPAPLLDERWPHIDGIDTADASSRWCGDSVLFTAMLARLFEEHREISPPPGVHDSSAIDLYVRRMHKLRGGACMLGAKSVSALAGQIEAACTAGDMDGALRLTATLESAMQLLAANAEPVLAAARHRMPVGVGLSVEALHPNAIEELGSLLRQQSLAAVDRFRSLSPQLRNLMGEASYKEMRLHVDNLQFYEASNDLRVSVARATEPEKTRAPRAMNEAG